MINGLNPYIATREAFAAARAAVGKATSEGRVSTVKADLRSLPHVPGIGTFDVIVLSNIVGSLVSEVGFGPAPLGKGQWRRDRFDADGLVTFVKSLT